MEGLSGVFPSRFKKSPAAVECHMTMSLFEQAPKKMVITADTESERKYLPIPCSLNGKLLLVDAGYVDLTYFNELCKNDAAFLVRGGKSLNPTIIKGMNGHGRLLPKLAGKKLKEITRRTNKSKALDLTVHWKNLECRVIRRWFKEEKRFCIWVTNLKREEFTADEVMSIYRCRWQIELLFKELKSDTNWTRFATEQKSIVEGLI